MAYEGLTKIAISYFDTEQYAHSSFVIVPT